VLEQEADGVCLMNRVRLPEAVFMNSDPSIENSSRGIEENAAPESSLSNFFEVLGDVHVASWEEGLGIHPLQAFDEWTLLRASSLFSDLNAEFDHAVKLPVVKRHEPFFESNLASHTQKR
jgi:hypothetical protein